MHGIRIPVKVMDYIMFFFYMDKGHLIAFCIITTYQIYSIALKCKGIDIVLCIILDNESIAKDKTCYKTVDEYLTVCSNYPQIFFNVLIHLTVSRIVMKQK